MLSGAKEELSELRVILLFSFGVFAQHFLTDGVTGVYFPVLLNGDFLLSVVLKNLLKCF